MGGNSGHFHVSLGNALGDVVGGHLMDGCTIFTTAEIVLGVSNEIVFKRTFDEATGFDELAPSTCSEQTCCNGESSQRQANGGAGCERTSSRSITGSGSSSSSSSSSSGGSGGGGAIAASDAWDTPNDSGDGVGIGGGDVGGGGATLLLGALVSLLLSSVIFQP